MTWWSYAIFDFIPKVLIAVPIALLFFDIVFQAYVYRHLPYNTLTNLSFAALAFGAVHVIAKLLPPVGEQPPVKGSAIFVLLAQFAVWVISLSVTRRLADSRDQGSRLFLSYVAGGAWFTLTVGLLLALLPNRPFRV